MTNAPSIALKQPETAATSANTTTDTSAYAIRRSSNTLLIRVLQFVADLVVLNLTYHLILLLRFGAFFAGSPERLGGAPWSIYPELEIFLNIFWAGIAILLPVYRNPRQLQWNEQEQSSGNLDQIRSVARAGLLLAGSLLLFIVAQGGYVLYSRLFLAYFLTSIPLVLVAVRIITQSAATTVRQQKSPRKNIIVIGAGSYGERFYDTVRTNPGYGYKVLGFLDDNGVDSHVRPMILGKLGDLERVANSQTIDEVVIALPKADENTISQLVAECEDRCIRVALLPSEDLSYGPLASRTIERVGDFSLVRMREAPLDQWANRTLKRSFDVLFSLLVLTTIFPIVFLVSAILIKLGSRGPIFFRQARTGEDGQTFTCYKFRTMKQDEEAAHRVQATKNDPRLTGFGRILRRTSMDELPQFWNVLRGEMSVMGPRPHMLKHTEDYRKIIAQYMVRHFAKPGLTGWAQVNGYRGATKNPDAMQRRIEHDLYYIENWSFLLDLTIVARTIVCILRGDKNAY
jgi:putative colanic acid biosynthesis UDP-glucose lipid carrier transferase